MLQYPKPCLKSDFTRTLAQCPALTLSVRWFTDAEEKHRTDAPEELECVRGRHSDLVAARLPASILDLAYSE